MEVGVLYCKVSFPKEHKLHWLSHCAITNILPKDLQIELKYLVDSLNQEYKDDLLIPIDNRIMPGCVSKPEKIEEIANKLYQGFISMFQKLGVEDPKIRLCYIVCDIPDESIINKESTHYIDPLPCMIKLGHSLDKSYEPGIYKL